MRLKGSDYDTLRRNFRWDIPEKFNIAEAVCWRHAVGEFCDAPALIHEDADGEARVYSFAKLAELAGRAANLLGHLGVTRADVVAIHLPQGPEALIMHLAIQAIGAIGLPLFTLFGPDAVDYRLRDSAARVLVTTGEGLGRIGAVLDGHEGLAHVLVVDREGTGGRMEGGREALEFWALMEQASSDMTPVPTSADDPAFLVYTSGTTGDPKGVILAQRVLLGHLPGIALPHDFFPRPGDRFWTPADWAWVGGLLDALLPSLYWGVPVVAGRAAKFDPDQAFAFMARHEIRNVFMPPTALRLMRQVERPRERHAHKLRSLGSGGESLGEDMIAWGRETFGLTMNEFYGQSEVNLVIGNSATLFDVRPGSMGRAIPGHDVAIVDHDGNPVEDGAEGIVAVRRPDPVMFSEYWRKPEATAAKFAGDWCLLGDVATRDEDGYFWFKGRDDDIIISAGYRIGPSEIEDCLARHQAVALAGVIGAADKVRGQVVTAYIVLNEGFGADEDLERELQELVRRRLAAHEYPRRMRFIAEMPLTVTGKIRRLDLRAMEAERVRNEAPDL